MENTVKPRFDQKGSEFGLLHRKLPLKCGMFDIDRMSAKATLNLELREQDVGFFEYRTNFNSGDIEWKALFEIKYRDSESVQKAISCPMGTATWAQLKLCELINAKYYIVIANNGKQPFTFYEYDYDGSYRIAGVLDYFDREIDGSEAINSFWKHTLKLA